MTSASYSAMKRPVLFMARDLAERAMHGKGASQRRARSRGQRRRGLRPARRFAPGPRGAACDRPVDEAGDNARARHDFEVAVDDAVELPGFGIERHEAEIAGGSHHGAADGVGQHAADREGFGDQRDDGGRQQGKARDEDEAEADQDLEYAFIDGAGTEIAELRKHDRDDYNHPRHEAGGEEAERDHEQADNQSHIASRIIRPSWPRFSSIGPGMTIPNGDMISPSSPWRAAPAARGPTASRSPISTARRRRGCRGRAAYAPATNSLH